MDFQNCKGYELVKEEGLPDIQSQGYLLRHKKTGAHIVLVSNDDSNKVFCIGFRTPPHDDMGAAHIVEHTVLCGSRQFPVKDPFIELAKGSLNTFLNAMTYPDKTIYPVASTNDKDFQNLMHVYLDAVFYPNIYSLEEIFQQEGWHYELESPDDPITINGVVYNEMKGAFSSPDDMLFRVVQSSLYPDTCYHYESGGDPEKTPQLTYEAFLDFHRRYYHPSNSYIYLYGDMDMEEKLNWIDENYLGNFDSLEIDSTVGTQEPFDAPVEVVRPYSVASNAPLEGNAWLSVNYSMGTILDPELYVAVDILNYALLEAPGAPLKKALLDAGICKDVMGYYENDIYQPSFSIIAKDSDLEKKGEFLAIVESVLKSQVRDGMNQKTLRAGINSFEFRYREADFGSFPKGLLFGMRCMDSWLYDENQPFLQMHELDVVERLKEGVAQRYFENLIEKYFLQNNHRAVVVITPERGLFAKKEQELEKRLAEYKSSLSPEEIEGLISATKHLEEYQEEPSTKEELATIPLLERADLKREAEPLSNDPRTDGETEIVYHDIESNGIAYLNFCFDASGVAVEDIPYLGILRATLGYMDTEHYGYGELSDEIDLHTGGISASIQTYPHAKDEFYDACFEMHVKTLYGEIPKALELVGEIVSSTKFTDGKRLYEIIAELKSRLQMAFSSSGNSVSAVRAMSYFSPMGKYSDTVGGITFYQLVKGLEADFDERKEDLMRKLQSLAELIFRKENLTVSLGSQPEAYDIVVGQLGAFRSKLFDVPVVRSSGTLLCEKRNEGFLDASQVQYVSRAGNFKKAGDYTGALQILKVILGYDYLWLNIRVKGGAYGCMSGFTRRGDAYFSSYRDPNLSQTNEVYEGIPEYLRNFDVDERDMTKYIIGTISEMDTPLTPSRRATRSFSAYRSGFTYEDVQKERDEVLDADAGSIRDLAPLVDAILEEHAICVIGNEGKIREEQGLFQEVKDLL